MAASSAISSGSRMSSTSCCGSTTSPRPAASSTPASRRNARSFADLANAVYTALGKQPQLRYIEMPEALRGNYQYFTEAKLDRLRHAGYAKPATPLEEGVRRYVQDFLTQPDIYR